MEARPRLRRGSGLRAQLSGARGEELAESYLRGLGYLILGRNFRVRFGEIDLIARDRQTTVFVEVKRRDSTTHGQPEDSVAPAKIRRVIAAARVYAARNKLSDRPIRFDVIAIHATDSHEEIRHHKGAFAT